MTKECGVAPMEVATLPAIAAATIAVTGPGRQDPTTIATGS